MSETSTKIDIRGFELGPYSTNCYVITAGGPGCWIIDASFEPGPLIEHVRSENLVPEKILLTHAHLDHIAGLDDVREAFPGVDVWIHEDESKWLSDPMLNLSAMSGMSVTSRDPEHTLVEGDTLTLSDSSWDVLHTPGHSPGGVVFVERSSNIAIVGDTLFAGSIGRFDFPSSDEQALYASIREKLYTLPDEIIAYPGHGPSTTIGKEKTTNPFVRA